MKFILKHTLIVWIILFIVSLFWLYKQLSCTHISIEFKDLRPFKEKLEVFYKGYPIGRAHKIHPSKDYKSSLIEATLHPNDLKLPKNITAKLKREKRRREKVDYIELIYPKKPSALLLKDGDVINGVVTIDIESYFASQEPASLDEIKQNLLNATASLQNAVDSLGGFFAAMQETVEQNQANLNETTKNLAQSSRNINEMTAKLNRSLVQDSLNNTVGNVEGSTQTARATIENLQIVSANIEALTRSINATMPQINTGIAQTGCIINNISEITCGISNTLKKQFGGLRLFFGKVIDEECSDCSSD